MVGKCINCGLIFRYIYLLIILLSFGGCGERNALADIPMMERDLNLVMAELGIKSRQFDIKVSKREVVLRGVEISGSATILGVSGRISAAAINNGFDRVSAARMEAGMPVVDFCHHSMPNLYMTWIVLDKEHANLYISSQAFKVAYAPCSTIYAKPK